MTPLYTISLLAVLTSIGFGTVGFADQATQSCSNDYGIYLSRHLSGFVGGGVARSKNVIDEAREAPTDLVSEKVILSFLKKIKLHTGDLGLSEEKFREKVLGIIKEGDAKKEFCKDGKPMRFRKLIRYTVNKIGPKPDVSDDELADTGNDPMLLFLISIVEQENGEAFEDYRVSQKKKKETNRAPAVIVEKSPKTEPAK